MGEMRRGDGETGRRRELEIELARLKIEHALLQELGRNSSPPF
jgi:hypothetical protein